jgi:hypothetical protein
LGDPNYLARFDGSFWAFAVTEEEQRAAGDPRACIHERYESRAHWLERTEEAVADLVARRFLLPEDGREVNAGFRRMVWPPKPIDAYPHWEMQASQ